MLLIVVIVGPWWQSHHAKFLILCSHKVYILSTTKIRKTSEKNKFTWLLLQRHRAQVRRAVGRGLIHIARCAAGDARIKVRHGRVAKLGMQTLCLEQGKRLFQILG